MVDRVCAKSILYRSYFETGERRAPECSGSWRRPKEGDQRGMKVLQQTYVLFPHTNVDNKIALELAIAPMHKNGCQIEKFLRARWIEAPDLELADDKMIRVHLPLEKGRNGAPEEARDAIYCAVGLILGTDEDDVGSFESCWVKGTPQSSWSWAVLS
nr:hypothetical protein Iba_chr02aCG7560 [Ipomoea batatas]